MRRLGATTPNVCGATHGAGICPVSETCSGMGIGVVGGTACCSVADALSPELPASRSGCTDSAHAFASADRGTAAEAVIAEPAFAAALAASAADCPLADLTDGRLTPSGCALTADAVDPSFSLGTVNCASVAARLAAVSSGFRLEAGLAIRLGRFCMAGVRIRCLSRPAISIDCKGNGACAMSYEDRNGEGVARLPW